MSKSTFGWRQAGFAGVAAALVAGGALIGVSTANAAPVTEGVTAASQMAVNQGQNPTASTPTITYTFGAYNTGAEVKATIAGNDCSTAAARLSNVYFYGTLPATVPSKVVASDTTAGEPAVGAAGPNFTTGLSSSSLTCGAGNNDVATFTSDGTDSTSTTLKYAVDLSGIQYNVGTKAPLGDININVVGNGKLPSGTVSNAVVGEATFAVNGFDAVKPGATGTVGATIKETAAGAKFASGTTEHVQLGLDHQNGATFNTTPLPTVVASAGHTISNLVVTANNVDFDVTTTAGAGAATITVSGISIKTDGITQIDLTSDVPASSSEKALNVMNFNARIGGHNRYDTAARLFNAGPGDGSEAAVLVNGTNFSFPDSLSAGSLAKSNATEETGILLTGATSLPQETKNAIQTNGVKVVYVVGGPLVVSDAVVAELRGMTVKGKRDNANLIVKRVAGKTRYLTNQAVNEEVGLNGDTALVATGNVFPDALALSPISFNQDMPLILTDGSSLSPEASSQLDAMSPSKVVIAGGPLAVSTGVETAIDNKTGVTTYRVAGGNRTETAAVIAEWATTGVLKDGATPGSYVPVSGYLGTPLGFTENATNIATGASPADALAAGPYAGNAGPWTFHNGSWSPSGEVILLSNDATSIGTGIVTYLSKKQVTSVQNLVAFGLQLAVNNSVLKGAAVATQK